MIPISNPANLALVLAALLPAAVLGVALATARVHAATQHPHRTPARR